LDAGLTEPGMPLWLRIRAGQLLSVGAGRA